MCCRIFLKKLSTWTLASVLFLSLVLVAPSRADTSCFNSVAPELAQIKSGIQSFLRAFTPDLNTAVQQAVRQHRPNMVESDEVFARLQEWQDSGSCERILNYRRIQTQALNTHPSSAPHFTDVMPVARHLREARQRVSSAYYAQCMMRRFQSKVNHPWSPLSHEVVIEELRALEGLDAFLSSPGALTITTSIVQQARLALLQIPRAIERIERACNPCADTAPPVLDRQNAETIAELNARVAQETYTVQVRDRAAEGRRMRWQQRMASEFLAHFEQQVMRIRSLAELVQVAQTEEQKNDALLTTDPVVFALEAEIVLSGTSPDEALYDYTANRMAWEVRRQALVGSTESLRGPAQRREALLTALRSEFTDQPEISSMAEALAQGGGNDEVRTAIWLATLSAAGNVLARHERLGVQIFQDKIIPVIVDNSATPPRIQNLLTGEVINELRGPIYKPQVFWAAFLDKARLSQQSAALPVPVAALLLSTGEPLAAYRAQAAASRSSLPHASGVFTWIATPYRSTPVPVVVAADPAVAPAHAASTPSTPPARPALQQPLQNFSALPIAPMRSHSQLVRAAVESLASPPRGVMDFDYARFLIEEQATDTRGMDQEKYEQAVRKYHETLDLIGTRLQSLSDPLERIRAAMDVLRERHLYAYNQSEAGLITGLTGAVAGFNVQGQTALVLGVFKALNLQVPTGFRLGVQVFSDSVQPVLYEQADPHRVYNIVYDRYEQRIQAPVYHPEIFLQSFMQDQRRRVRRQSPVTPEQLLIVGASPGVPNEHYRSQSAMMGRSHRELSWPESRNSHSLNPLPARAIMARGENGEVHLTPLPLDVIEEVAASSRRPVRELLQALREARRQGHTLRDLIRLARESGLDLGDIPPGALARLEGLSEAQIDALLATDPSVIEAMISEARASGALDGDFGEGERGDGGGMRGGRGGSLGGGGGIAGGGRERREERRYARDERRRSEATTLISNLSHMDIIECQRLFDGSPLEQECYEDFEQTVDLISGRDFNNPQTLEAVYNLCVRTRERVLTQSPSATSLYSGQSTEYPVHRYESHTTRKNWFSMHSCRNPTTYSGAEPAGPRSVAEVTFTGTGRINSDEFVDFLKNYFLNEPAPAGLGLQVSSSGNVALGGLIMGSPQDRARINRCSTVQEYYTRNVIAHCRDQQRARLEYYMTQNAEAVSISYMCEGPSNYRFGFCEVEYNPLIADQAVWSAGIATRAHWNADMAFRELQTTYASQSLFTPRNQITTGLSTFFGGAATSTEHREYLTNRIHTELQTELRPHLQQWMVQSAQASRGELTSVGATQTAISGLLQKCRSLVTAIYWQGRTDEMLNQVCSPSPQAMAPLQAQHRALSESVAANPEGTLVLASQMRSDGLNNFMRLLGATPTGRLTTEGANRLVELLVDPGRVAVGSESHIFQEQRRARPAPAPEPAPAPAPVPERPTSTARVTRPSLPSSTEYITVRVGHLAQPEAAPVAQAEPSTVPLRRGQREVRRIYLSADRMGVLLLNGLSQQSTGGRQLLARWTPEISMATARQAGVFGGSPDLTAALLMFEDREVLTRTEGPCVVVPASVVSSLRIDAQNQNRSQRDFSDRLPPGSRRTTGATMLGYIDTTSYISAISQNYMYLREQMGIPQGRCTPQAVREELERLLN